MKKLCVAMVLAVACMAGCTQQGDQGAAPQAAQSAPEPVKELEFNTSDKAIESNGNVIVAGVKMMKQTPEELWGQAQKVSASKLTKSPYSSLGKLCKITGTIYKVEEMPPTEGLTGTWAEMLVMVDDPNSAAGVTTVSYIYNGDIEHVNANQTVTCAGYFAGTYKSQNMMGGEVEGLVLVGNKLTRL